MTIQRQYSLPNCKLVVEGLSEESGGARPVVTQVVNAECHFPGHEQPMKGGREFLENLSQTVSNYAQEFLSGVHHTQRSNSGPVHLQRLEPNLHRLTFTPANGIEAQAAGLTQVDLKTVQLFDLVEAIDQLYADAQTLPSLQLNLSPLPKRAVASTEPVARQAIPAAVGVSGLAVAAIALFFVPVPERRPAESTSSEASPAATSPSPTVSSSASATPSAVASPEVAATPVSSSEAASPTPEQLAGVLSNGPEITDPDTLQQLKRQLRNTLDADWKTTPTFSQELVYRVSVAKNGDITGFKYVNNASINYVKETPLADVSYTPVEGAPTEAIAQFRVVFKPSGVLEVSPWHGLPEDNP